MRLFVAIDFSEETKQKISEIIQRLKKTNADVKWVGAENIHLTLKFLGEVPDDRINDVEKLISDSLAGTKPFEIEIDGVGFFGSDKYLKTIWFDISKNKDNVIRLIETLNSALDHIRHETHEPSTHVTIGRPRTGRNKELLLKEINALSKQTIGTQMIRDIKLKKSVLTAEGPIYSDVKVFKL